MLFSAREAAHRAASDAERVAWVDEADHPLGGLPRAQLRSRGLIGRGTYILLFNSAGELCVHRRTLSKAVYPGYWDVAAGGMVMEGEAYDLSAVRELAEELGVEGVTLREYARFFFDQGGCRLWCRAYVAQWDGPLTVQPEEVLEARFMPLGEVLRQTRINLYCPDSLVALEHYLQTPGSHTD